MTPRRWKAGLGLLVAGAVMLGLACCSSLPTIVPDLSQRPRAPVPLSGAHGPLTAERSQAVLAALARRSPTTDIFTRHLALEEAIVGSPLTVGNEVLLLQDGPATYRAMLAAIAGGEGPHPHGDLHPGRR